MACEIHLGEYLDGELSGEARRRLEAHLSDCAECRRRVELEQAFQRDLHRAPAARRGAAPRPGADDRAPRRARRLAAGAPAPGRAAGGARRSRPRRWRWSSAGVAGGAAHRRRASAPLRRPWCGWPTPRSSSTRSWRAASCRSTSRRCPRRRRSAGSGRSWTSTSGCPISSGTQLTFVGGRLSHLDGFDVAALEFRVDHQNVSLFIMPAEQYEQARTPRRSPASRW